MEALLESGYSKNTINEVKNTSIEEALYERAQLPEDELRDMGYSQEKIELLKEYDGSPLSENPQMRGVFANLTGSMLVPWFTKTYMQVVFSWEWDAQPFLSGSIFTDIVTCGFAGTNDDNGLDIMTFVESNSRCTITYYSANTRIGRETYEISVQNPHQHVEVKFPMSKVFGNHGGYAKKGSLTIMVKEEKTVGKLYSCAFAFGYGHTGILVSPSISVSAGSGFSGGIGLSFGLNTENMFYKTMILRHDGQYEIFKGG